MPFFSHVLWETDDDGIPTSQEIEPRPQQEQDSHAHFMSSPRAGSAGAMSSLAVEPPPGRELFRGQLSPQCSFVFRVHGALTKDLREVLVAELSAAAEHVKTVG